MNRSLRFLIAGLSIAWCVLPSTSRAQSWPMFRQNAAHTGATNLSGPLSPDQLWSADISGYTYSSPVIASNRIFMASENKLFAFGSNGLLDWTFNLAPQMAGSSVSIAGLVSTPAVGSDGTVYLGSLDSSLYAVDINGNLKWTFDTNGQIFSSPVLGLDGSIYVGSRSKSVFAITPQGTTKWSTPVSGEVVSSPALGPDGSLYVGSTDDRLYAFNSENGSQKWPAYVAGAEIVSSPAVGPDGAVYFGSMDGRMHAVNGGSGQSKWAAPFEMNASIVSSPALASNGTLYAASFEGKLYAINSATGNAKWAVPFETGAPITGSPAIDSNGFIYITSLDGSLYVLADGGNQPILRWAFPTGSPIWASPAIGASNRVYIAATGTETQPGRLFAIGQASYNVVFTSQPIAGQEAQVQVQLTGTGAPASGTFSYRIAGTSAFQSQPFNGSITIPVTSVTGLGLEYFVQGPDGSFPAFTPQQRPATQRVFVTSQKTPVDLLPRVNRMISIPYDLSDPSIETILGDDYGAYGPLRWRLFRWSGSAYVEYPALSADFEPGTAFFLVTFDGAEYDIESGLSVDTSQPYALTLKPGWNQVGNPFGFPVAWNTVIRDPAAISSIAFFNGAEMVQNPIESGILYPWEGYFVYNASGGEESLLIPPVGAEVPVTNENDTEESAGKLSASANLLRITASLPDAGLIDSQNWVGFDAEAIDGLDRFDAIEAPPFGEHLRLSILEGDLRYAVNFKPLQAQGAAWSLELTTTVSEEERGDQPVTLSFEKEDGFAEAARLVLIDEDFDYALDVTNDLATIAWGYSLDKRRLTLIAGSDAFVASRLGDLTVAPLETMLEANFPNPFQQSTRIRYRLSQQSNVSLTVFNMLGQEVQTLVQGAQNPGTYETLWDGRDAAGRRAGSGIYLYRLQADSFTATGKMVLLN